MTKRFYITEDDFVKAKKKQERKANFKKKASSAAKWTLDNMGNIVMVAPVVTVVAMLMQ